MKNKIYLIFTIFLIAAKSNAQQFISKASVEYEVKTNIKKSMGNGMWAEMMKENMPEFKTGYYTYTFADNKSVYKFDHWDPNQKMPDYMIKNDEDNSWYFDYNSGKYNMQKNVAGSKFNVEDSIAHINWKLENEHRIIAGFDCRKAVGIIMDSVYVFAYYTDEITATGGPCSINGLPGLILGLTIPRIYTSWIATRVMVNGISESTIKPVTAKKYYTTTGLKKLLKERLKEWINEDDPDSKNEAAQFFWNAFL